MCRSNSAHQDASPQGHDETFAKVRSPPALGGQELDHSHCQTAAAHAGATLLNTRMPRWWSRTGSNRRPPACKAGALPPELRPRVVGLGRLELPTSRLSGVRSNRLSYRPIGARPAQACTGHSGRKEMRRRRRAAICSGSADAPHDDKTPCRQRPYP